MGFTAGQVAAMSQAEVDCRVCRRSNAGGYGTSGWDDPLPVSDAWATSAELLGLLYPDVYPPGYPPHVCGNLNEALAAASRLGMLPEDDEVSNDPDAIARGLLV